MKIYHSQDGGRTWREIEVKETSVVGFSIASRLAEDVIYDDGYGNLYRKELPK